MSETETTAPSATLFDLFAPPVDSTPVPAPLPEVQNQASVFRSGHGAIWELIERSKGEPTLKQITNWLPEYISSTVDAESGKSKITLRVRLNTGQIGTTLHLSRADFLRPDQWAVESHEGAFIRMGRVSGEFKGFLQELLMEADVSRITHGRPGWLPDRSKFISNLTEDLQLPSQFDGFHLPDPQNTTTEHWMKWMQNFDVATDRITFPLVGLALAAFIPPQPPFGGYIVGATQTGKTYVARNLIQSHWGRHLAPFTGKNDTSNALEALLHMARSLPVVIDDIVDATGMDTKRLKQLIDSATRGTTEQTGRGRLTEDSELKATFIPAALPIFTGEFMDVIPSVEARLIRITVATDTFDSEILRTTIVQNARSHVNAQITSCIIDAIRGIDLTEIFQDVHDANQSTNSRFWVPGHHEREKINLAVMFHCYKIAMDVAVQGNYLSIDTASAFLSRAEKALRAYCMDATRQNSPEETLIQAITDAYASGKYRRDHRDSSSDPANKFAQVIGRRYDDSQNGHGVIEYVIVSHAHRLYTEAGGHLPPTALGEILRTQNCLAKRAKAGTQIAFNVGGENAKCWPLRAELFTGVPDSEEVDESLFRTDAHLAFTQHLQAWKLSTARSGAGAGSDPAGHGSQEED